MALEVTDASFASDIIESGKPAMVDFWAVNIKEKQLLVKLM